MTIATTLRAGAARVDITPPVPIDLVGYSRRWQPAVEVRRPLSVTALVLEGTGERVAIAGIDTVAFRTEQATAIRELVARAIGTRPESVLLNMNHTHAAPHWSYEGGVKIGGNQREVSEVERRFIDLLPHKIVAAATMAAGRLEPVRAGAGVGSVNLAVNRRERTPDGRTILGWNPDGPVDRDVGVLRLDRPDGSPLAIVVNFACHPVVVGPEVPEVNPDFPGPMRELVEQVSGATCLFLQGAAGNILPLEGFFDHPGPEERFGHRLAIEALRVAFDIETAEHRVVKLEYGSATPISLYRRVPAEQQPEQPLAVAARWVEFPFKYIPTIAQVEEELARYRRDLEQAQAAGADRARLNPLEYHVNWAEDALRQLRAGNVGSGVPAFLQAIRIGDAAIVSVPGEAFAEIALAIKARSPARRTLFAGYANGVVCYLPSAAEHPFGGYEVDYPHHSYGLVAPLAPETEGIIVETSLELLRKLFAA